MKKKVATFSDGDVYSYKIENSQGMSLTAINFGAAITEILVPDQEGVKENVVIHYDDISLYETNPHYLGVVVGRTSGRTKDAMLKFRDQEFQLDKNDGNNHLHGGEKGLAKRIWDVTQKDNTLIFEYFSADGEDNYPGDVQFKISYTLSDSNQLIIHYWALPNETTPINLTNHSYFNLTGNLKRNILGHHLTVASSKFYELDEESIPLDVKSVESRPTFDFRKGKLLNEMIADSDDQINLVGGGLDHPFIFDKWNEEKVVLVDQLSGRSLHVKTDDPAIVIYSGNQVKQSPLLNKGKAEKYAGICLETQMPPNETKSYIVEKGNVYEKQTTFTFGIL
ncbi:aldose epimerase family protein [Salipaludibacillus daqingensis]|uniref:aldose epimerase family protein n=1 Tax=Salipaludibacillus daqingensis TaxID=3041001 RepID=UPI00247602CB|nr:aldose epimerase family protein [Salipaludibacillus daqingensis]